MFWCLGGFSVYIYSTFNPTCTIFCIQMYSVKWLGGVKSRIYIDTELPRWALNDPEKHTFTIKTCYFILML